MSSVSSACPRFYKHMRLRLIGAGDDGGSVTEQTATMVMKNAMAETVMRRLVQSCSCGAVPHRSASLK